MHTGLAGASSFASGPEAGCSEMSSSPVLSELDTSESESDSESESEEELKVLSELPSSSES